MARLNKTETMEAARKLAQRNADVTAITTEAQVEALGDWQARTLAASTIAATVPVPENVPERYAADFRAEFAQAALRVWAEINKRAENARRDFKRAADGLTITEATEQIVTLLRAMNIRGGTVESSYGITLRVERSWAIGADLMVRFDESFSAKGIENPDNPLQRVSPVSGKVELNWSGTSRSVSESLAAIKVYTELTEAAAEVEAVIARMRIVYKWGFEGIQPSGRPTIAERTDASKTPEERAADAAMVSVMANDTTQG